MNFSWCSVSGVMAIVAFFSIGIEVSQAMWTDFELGTLKDMNGTGSVIEFNVKSKRMSRTTFGITGQITLNDDFKNYDGEVKVYVSAKGNDQYILSPLKIPRGPLCSKINDDYRKFLMKELGTTSDLPSSDDEDICPLFVKKTYNVKDYLFATDNIPKFLQPGWYKVHIMISDKSGTLVSGLELTCHLY